MNIVRNIMLISAAIVMTALAIYVVFLVGTFIVDEIRTRMRK